MFARAGCAESLRAEMERGFPKGPPVSTSVDLPLSENAKRVLQLSEEQADVLGHPLIEGGHLLLAMVWRERGFVGELLERHRIDEICKERDAAGATSMKDAAAACDRL